MRTLLEDFPRLEQPVVLRPSLGWSGIVNTSAESSEKRGLTYAWQA